MWSNVKCSRCLTYVLSLFLSLVPPIIEPFSFQEGLAESMRTRTVCGVSGGDQPLTIRWLKDGQPLSSERFKANVTSLDSYSSLLSIASLTAEHSGLYTCVASNPAAEVRLSARLQVKGIKGRHRAIHLPNFRRLKNILKPFSVQVQYL